jgi:hypothetical protein
VLSDAEADVVSPEGSTAICVQRLDDSRNSAIHTTYRISLRSSSLREPRYPLLRVVSVASAGGACGQTASGRLLRGGEKTPPAGLGPGRWVRRPSARGLRGGGRTRAQDAAAAGTDGPAGSGDGSLNVD